MGIRTDLATELRELNPNASGIKSSKAEGDGYTLSVIEIENEEAAKKMGKPVGRYLTFEADMPFDAGMTDSMCESLAKELTKMLPQSGTVLVAGLGNANATPDAVGPKTASGVLATRHIRQALTDGLGIKGIRDVAVICPGVLGQTGVETLESVQSAVEKTKPGAVVVVDALAARRLARIGRTVQLCNSGILPGSGVGNRRSEISRKTLGVNVISVGIPTVADVSTVISDASGNKSGDEDGMIVTSPGIDTVVSRGSAGLAKAINFALQPDMDRDTLLSLI